MMLEYYRVRLDVIPPTRANPSDAGLDVYYNPKEAAIEGVSLKPGESKLFSTGLKFGIPHGYMLEVKNRSGNASKRSLLVGACIVDSGYDGEVFVNLHNVGTGTQFIHRGMKVAQIVMVPVIHFRAVETMDDNLYEWYPISLSSRGDGALGSTDRKNSVGDIDPFEPRPPEGDWEIGDKL